MKRTLSATEPYVNLFPLMSNEATPNDYCSIRFYPKWQCAQSGDNYSLSTIMLRNVNDIRRPRSILRPSTLSDLRAGIAWVQW